MNKTYFIVISIFFYSIFCFGCIGPDIKISKNSIYENSVPANVTEYLLGPGDVIEIFYTFETRPTYNPYRLSSGDSIRVEFQYHTELNRELILQPDGKIMLPLKGELEAVNLTPMELNEKITKLFSDVYQNPVVTVTLLKFNQPLVQFQEAIKSDRRGQSRLLKIRPDGYITFPVIGDIMAAGKTIPIIREKATQKYQEDVESINISLMLQVANSNLVYVLGEVRKPDYYKMENPTTVSQILSRAGLIFESAELSTIIVISRSNENEPFGRIFNLEEVLAHANIRNDILLKQYDVIYVPKTKIDKAGVFVENYFNRLVPKFFRTGLSFYYDIND